MRRMTKLDELILATDNAAAMFAMLADNAARFHARNIAPIATAMEAFERNMAYLLGPVEVQEDKDGAR